LRGSVALWYNLRRPAGPTIATSEIRLLAHQSSVTRMPSVEQSLAQFLARLASAEPTPGGGSASALAGALAAALIAMVCRLTLGKEQFAGRQAEVRLVLDRTEPLLHRLAEAVDEDAQAYEAVVSAYRLPRGDQIERQTRRESVQRALHTATRVPLQVANDCAQLLDLVTVVLEKGNPNALSDAKVAAHLAEAGLRGAVQNVVVNLPGIEDLEFVERVQAEVTELLHAIPERAPDR